LAIEDYSKLSDDELRGIYTNTNKLISRYRNLQMSKKVQLNSCYGSLGNQFNRFYDIRLASSITLAGQLAIKWIERKLNEYLGGMFGEGDYILAIDTDSVYICFEKMIDKYLANEKDEQKIADFLDRICRDKIEKFIEKSYQELADYTNAYEQKMHMSREIIANKGFWTAKKRYALNVYRSETVKYAEPILKVVGLEVIKSSTPAVCRAKLMRVIEIIMREDENTLIKYISEFKKEFSTLLPQDIAFPRSINGLEKYKNAKKGIPIHVRGSLHFNNKLIEHNLDSVYPTIKEGEKIKYIYLKEPNVVHDYVISFSNTIPKEFDIIQYIDYDKQFQKTFIEPLRFILGSIGWEYERKHTLMDYME
jgi:DNA polymerase elongation subunit (family B)